MAQQSIEGLASGFGPGPTAATALAVGPDGALYVSNFGVFDSLSPL
jgi:hypothetical protein